jgi:hypothetical protein
MKKLSVIALLSLSLFSIQANALVPLLVILGGGGTAMETAITASVAIHAAVIGIAFKDEISGVVSPTAAPLQVNLAPKVADRSSVPAGWAAGASQYASPVPPLTASGSGGGQSLPDLTEQNAIDACIATYNNLTCASGQTGSAGYWNQTSISTIHCTVDCKLSGYPYTVISNANSDITYGSGSGGVTPNVCPSGYTSSGSSCNLTAPESVPLPNDAKQTVKRTGNALAVPATDTDPLPQGTTASANVVTYTDPSSGGVTTITTDSVSGSSSVKYVRYDPAIGKTLTDTFNLDAPTDSNATSVSVSGVSHSESAGGGSLAAAAGGTLAGSSSAATGADTADGSNAIVNKLEELKNSATSDAERECKLHPDRLACKDAGEMPDTELLTNIDKNVAITPISVSNAAGICPADKTFTASNGFNVALSYAPVCEGASNIRPIIIALAWLSAALLLVGASRKDS